MVSVIATGKIRQDGVALKNGEVVVIVVNKRGDAKWSSITSRVKKVLAAG